MVAPIFVALGAWLQPTGAGMEQRSTCQRKAGGALRGPALRWCWIGVFPSNAPLGCVVWSPLCLFFCQRFIGKATTPDAIWCGNYPAFNRMKSWTASSRRLTRRAWIQRHPPTIAPDLPEMRPPIQIPHWTEWTCWCWVKYAPCWPYQRLSRQHCTHTHGYVHSRKNVPPLLFPSWLRQRLHILTCICDIMRQLHVRTPSLITLSHEMMNGCHYPSSQPLSIPIIDHS